MHDSFNEDCEDEHDDVDIEDDAEPTRPCPYCHGQIHEDTQRCPYCEQYISAEDSGPSAKPGWLYAGVVICLVIVFLWIWYGV